MFLSIAAATNLHTLRLKQDEYFGALNHLALAITALISPVIFQTDLALLQWILVVTNVVASIPIPSHHVKDDEDDKLPGLIQNFENLI